MQISTAIQAPLLIFLLITAPVTIAHDFWIEASDYSVRPGEGVDLTLRVGMDFGGDTVPFIDSWFSDFSVHSPARVTPVQGTMGDDPAGRFVPDEPGIYIAAYRSTRDFVDLGPEKFLSYLRDEGLERIAVLREKRGESGKSAPEYYSRCAKSLVQAGASTPNFDKVLGYTLELIPERDPYSLKPGDDLPLKLLYESRPIEDILVIAINRNDPAVRVSARTGDDGRVTLPLAAAGAWLVKAVHMIEVPASDPNADWESFWASLTFELPATVQ